MSEEDLIQEEYIGVRATNPASIQTVAFDFQPTLVGGFVHK